MKQKISILNRICVIATVILIVMTVVCFINAGICYQITVKDAMGLSDWEREHYIKRIPGAVEQGTVYLVVCAIVNVIAAFIKRGIYREGIKNGDNETVELDRIRAGLYSLMTIPAVVVMIMCVECAREVIGVIGAIIGSIIK